MKVHQGVLAALTVAALASSQQAVAALVHVGAIGTFTIGDRRGQEFALDLRYDSDALATSTTGNTTTFANAGDIFTITVTDPTSNLMAFGTPANSTVFYDLGPPTGIVENTPNGRRVTFTDAAGTVISFSFFYDTTSLPGVVSRLPTLADLALFSGGEVTFNGDGRSGTGPFRFFPLTNAVPEPTTWGMMILGFGAISAEMRMRRRKISVSYV
ncbi:MAG: PEPxxWA-CTERM sorting domain-containing protein [Sphingomonadales bacterium]